MKFFGWFVPQVLPLLVSTSFLSSCTEAISPNSASSAVFKVGSELQSLASPVILEDECERGSRSACATIAEIMLLTETGKDFVPESANYFSRACSLGDVRSCARFGGQSYFYRYRNNSGSLYHHVQTRRCSVMLGTEKSAFSGTFGEHHSNFHPFARRCM